MCNYTESGIAFPNKIDVGVCRGKCIQYTSKRTVNTPSTFI